MGNIYIWTSHEHDTKTKWSQVKQTDQPTNQPTNQLTHRPFNRVTPVYTLQTTRNNSAMSVLSENDRVVTIAFKLLLDGWGR